MHKEVLDGMVSFEIHFNPMFLQMFLELSLRPWTLLLLLVLTVFLSVPCFVLVFLFCLMLALIKAHSGYLHLLNALFRWSSSFFSSSWLEQSVLALCLRMLITLSPSDHNISHINIIEINFGYSICQT